ncbi:membrane protein insertion efficiency factor YidD [Maribellus maritimus]|uniref:membrane protein insertion efficiency factor YidD n=1 Tax=Maribellus maritimus TaxID=2870838 RepID=UPI001EEB85D2|nr:membrane protein insertion efficiency factor YidD [Maribellus maritimus]MCG6187508.1 membrane protein insertion efficiency factor YidD [Maribellus maritimus]
MTRNTIMNWSVSKVGNILILLFAFLLFAGKLNAQNNDPYGFKNLKGLFEAGEHVIPKYSSTGDKQKNELEFILATGFNTYKAFFSSQDNPSCVFYPSCSVYSVEAFQQKGLFLGTLYTFDRLSRCHRLVKANEYIYNPEKQRFYDPLK